MSIRIAVAGWFGSDNLGDEMILRSLVLGLRARGAEPVAVSIDPDGTGRDHSIEALRHRSPAHSLTLARSLRNIDGLIVAGGIVQAETSPWNLPFHASRLLASRSTGERSAAVGLGAGRVRGRFGPALARAALGKLGAIVVRDHDSARLLARWGLPDTAVGADPALSLDAPPPSAPGDTMAVILRPPNRRGAGTAGAKARRWARTDPDRHRWIDQVARSLDTASRHPPAAPAHPPWIDQVARSLDAAASTAGLAVRMVSFQPSRDGLLHRAVAERLQTPAELVTPALDSVLTEVARSKLVVTMRYHGAVAALLGDRPAVMIDYSPKMSALAAEGGGWAPLVPSDELKPDRLAAAVSAALSDPGRVAAARAELNARLAINHAAIDRLLDGLR